MQRQKDDSSYFYFARRNFSACMTPPYDRLLDRPDRVQLSGLVLHRKSELLKNGPKSYVNMLIRLRSKAGTWRVPDLTAASTILDIKKWVEKNHAIALDRQTISADAKGARPLSNTTTLRSLQCGHGDMLFLDFEGDPILGAGGGGSVQMKINADGSLTHATYDTRLEKTGFRPGMKALRDMKMHWTLGEFIRMDAQFEFKLKAQEKGHCEKVALDSASCNSFQSYLRQFAFQQSRCGWLYGTIDKATAAASPEMNHIPS